MPVTVPPAIQGFVDATNAADSAAFLSWFAQDAYLNDWGREFRGHDEIASWNTTDNIGVESRFELLSADPGDSEGSFTVTMAVSGDGFNGTSTFSFTLRDGLISRLILS
jgi:hypothetical protein